MLWSNILAVVALVPCMLAKPIVNIQHRNQAEIVARSQLERRDVSKGTYTVVRTDTGNAISAAYSITFAALRAANPNVNWNNYYVGQVINMPSARVPYQYTVASGDTQASVAKKYNIYTTDLSNANSGITFQTGAKIRVPSYGAYSTYSITSGDTGNAIASAFGITFNSLSSANPGVNWNALQIGQALTIPAGVSPTQGTLPSPAVPPKTSTTLSRSTTTVSTTTKTTTTASSTTLGTTTKSSTTISSTTVSSTTVSSTSRPPSTTSSVSSSSSDTSTSASTTTQVVTTTTSKSASSSSSSTTSVTTSVSSFSTSSVTVSSSSASPSTITTSSISTTTKSVSSTTSTASSSTGATTPSTTASTTSSKSTTSTTTSTTTRAGTGEPVVTPTATVTGANYVKGGNNNDGVGARDDTYTFYKGDGSSGAGWPAKSQWISFSNMWNTFSPFLGQSCQSQYGVANNSPQENQYIYNAIQAVATNSGVDHRIILAAIIKESSGCVRVKTTISPDGTVTNPGLMQDFNGSGSCNSNGVVQNPCPASQIYQMISDGVFGTSSDGGQNYVAGLVQDINSSPDYTGSQVIYRAFRIYNSGNIPANGDLGAPGATRCYASDMANLLMGWVNAARTCDLDR